MGFLVLGGRPGSGGGGRSFICSVACRLPRSESPRAANSRRTPHAIVALKGK